MNKCDKIDIIDFHAHILPGVDHGSLSVETSQKQLTLAQNASVSRIIATSHFYPQLHDVESFIDVRNNAYENLIKAQGNMSYPEIRLGAEVLICDGMDRLPELEKLCIMGTRALLIELPFSDFSSEYTKCVYRLIDAGYEIVLAHADRYRSSNIQELINVGAKVQLNADSLAAFIIPKHLRSWIEQGVVVALGSDIHGAKPQAYKAFEKARRRLDTAATYIAEASNKIWNASKPCELIY